MFVTENFEKIETSRQKENLKDLVKQAWKDLDVELPAEKEKWPVIPEPIPSESHTYCQVCNETYEDYL
jgi:hypothetical protein